MIEDSIGKVTFDQSRGNMEVSPAAIEVKYYNTRETIRGNSLGEALAWAYKLGWQARKNAEYQKQYTQRKQDLELSEWINPGYEFHPNTLDKDK